MLKKFTNLFGSLRIKISFVFFNFTVLTIALIYLFVRGGMANMEEQLYDSRLIADIHYIEDIIGSGSWNIQGDAIYLGDTLVGDGTDENANLAPFLEHAQKTGTFSYVFIITGDEGLGYVESTKTQVGYQEGHYLRVAGSTKSPDGKSIVGTYISKSVADALDKDGEYAGESNVAGGMIYCYYHTLLDDDDNVVGAIVVGRNVSELKALVNDTTYRVIFGIIVCFAIFGFILLFFVHRWTRTLYDVTNYMKQIESGELPEHRLLSKTNDELSQLVIGVNSLVDTLKENSVLKIKSETDPMTGLANRFGLSRYSESIFEECYKEKLPIAFFMLDIDYFKPFNDNYGHQAGDEAILALSDTIKEVGEKYPLFASRYGGDEFLVIMYNYSRSDVEMIAKLLKQKIYNKNLTHEYSKVSDRLSISIGVCYGVPCDYQHMNDYLHRADEALYLVKEATKNDYKILDILPPGKDSTSP